MPLESTISEIRARLSDPDRFKAGSLRRKDLPSIQGVALIVGKLKSTFVPDGGDPDAMVTQAVRFSKKYWTKADAGRWLEAHRDKLTDSQIAYDAHRKGECADCKEFGSLLDSAAEKATDEHYKRRFTFLDKFEVCVQYEPGEERHDHKLEGCGYGFLSKHVSDDDQEHLDIIFGLDESSTKIFRIEQRIDGVKDEDKYCIYFTDAAAAEKAYKTNWPPEYFGEIAEVDSAELEDFYAPLLLDSRSAQRVTARVVSTERLTDAVESTIEITEADTPNGNGRGYSKASLRRTAKIINGLVANGLDQIFDEHPPALYNEQGKLRFYDPTTNELLAHLKESWLDESTGKLLGKIRWRIDRDLGKEWADKALAKEDVFFSIRGKLIKCTPSQDGEHKQCDIEGWGLDRTDTPAQENAKVLSTEVVADSVHTDSTQDRDGPLGVDCACGCQGTAADCTNSIPIGAPAMSYSNHVDLEKISKAKEQGLNWKQYSTLFLDYPAYSAEQIAEIEAAFNAAGTSGTTATPPPADTSTSGTTDMDKPDDPPPPATTDSGEGDNPDKPKEEPPAATDMSIPEAAIKKAIEMGMDWEGFAAMLMAMEMPEEAITAAGEMFTSMKAQMTSGDTDMSKNNTAQDTKGTPVNPPAPATTGAPATDSTPKGVTIPEQEYNELKGLLLETKQSKARADFEAAVDQKITDSKIELTDAEKQALRAKALGQPDKTTGLAVLQTALDMKAEQRASENDLNKQLADSRRVAMGYMGGGTAAGHTVITGMDMTESMPAAEMLDKIDKAIDSNIKAGYIDVESRDLVLRQRAEKRALAKDSTFMQDVVQHLRAQPFFNEKITDAITNADIHGPTTVFNRDKVLEMAFYMQIFYNTTFLDTLCMALGPGAPQNMPIPARNAKAQKLGSVFVMGLETVSENAGAKARHYRIARNAGTFHLVNTGFQHNIFPTRSRGAGEIVDTEMAMQMVTGPFDYDLYARTAFNSGNAVSRAIDDELGEDMIQTTREVGAVFKATETPAGNGATAEWLYNAGGSQGGYGANVVGVASLLGPYATTELKTSATPGTKYPAPLVLPRVKANHAAITGQITEYTPFPITITLPGGTAAVEGFYNTTTNLIESYPDAPNANWAPDPINARILFTSGANVDASNKPVISYWYSTNYYIVSKTKGLWNPTNGFISGLADGAPLKERAGTYLDILADVIGLIGEEKFNLADTVVEPWNFCTSYVARAERFDKQISPTDAVLYNDYGKSTIALEDTGLVHYKVNNPTWSKAYTTISGMGQAFSSLVYKRFSNFYGLGALYPDTGWYNVTKANGATSITEAVNALRREFGMLDTVGTPVYSDGRNYPNFEIIVVD